MSADVDKNKGVALETSKHTGLFTLEQMTLLLNFVETISACGVISQILEKASLQKKRQNT